MKKSGNKMGNGNMGGKKGGKMPMTGNKMGGDGMIPGAGSKKTNKKP